MSCGWRGAISKQKGRSLSLNCLFLYVAGSEAETESANVEPVNFVVDFLVFSLVALLAPFIVLTRMYAIIWR